MAEPADADPFADPQLLDRGTQGVDAADDLVARDDEYLWIGKLTI
jgi:hypothetical protein